MGAIDIRGLGKHYAGTDVLRQVDLTIDEGEFIVLVGPSGCGKSTLLRIIAGLEDISEGELYIGGLLSNAVKARARNVAMVFQSYALYPHMTVEENIGFALKVAGLSKAERNRRVRDVAKSLGLEQLLQRKPKALSGGQRQRVAIGRAIVRHPKVFLMDEPLSNLDAKLRVEMRAEMRALHARLGVTTVYVTHDQVEALTLGSRVAVLRPIGESGNTNIQQFATPTELFERPHNVFVAGFMGSPPMNILLAKLVRRDGTFEISMGDIAIALPQAAQNQALADAADRADGHIVIGMRPSDIGVARPGAAAFNTRITDMEMLGDQSSVSFSASTPAVPFDFDFTAKDAYTSLLGGSSSTKISARLEGRLRLRTNDEVSLAIDPARIYFFDARTGLALGNP